MRDTFDHFDTDPTVEEQYPDEPWDEPEDDLTDAEADAMTLRDAGFGTDEDYGDFGGGGFFDDGF